mmetsp:Transcript_25355/g.71321  ORF Transcript_25355/g.71321 Transcript_25355/m.71321 type:complete len:221 (+) Transcript_25355:94-756(+)
MKRRLALTEPPTDADAGGEGGRDGQPGGLVSRKAKVAAPALEARPPPKTDHPGASASAESWAEKSTPLLDRPTLDALRASASPFLAGTSPPLPSPFASARVIAAVQVASTNPNLAMFGVDGSHVELDAAAASALASLAVPKLVFPLELRFSRAARAAFVTALGSNRSLQSLCLSCTNVDAEEDQDDDVVDGWSPGGSLFRQTRTRFARTTRPRTPHHPRR